MQRLGEGLDHVFDNKDNLMSGPKEDVGTYPYLVVFS